MYKNKVLFPIILLLFAAQITVSQNNTNSPYTRFGYGDISDNNSGEQRAMGGVSIGTRSHYGINTVNPASYSSVDSLTFMFDIGSSVLGSRFSESSTKSHTTFNSNLEYVTMQFPLSKTLGFSLGMLPYSFSGYNFQTTDSIVNVEQDTINYTKSFSGSGGFTQVYTGISVSFFNHISLGVNAYYMFGTIKNSRLLYLGSTNGYSSTNQDNTLIANNFRFRFGAQFYNTFAKKHDVSLGLIYEPQAKLNGSFSQITSGVLTDTITPNYEFELPTIYGIGLNYTYDKKISIGLDYSFQGWSDAKFFYQSDSLTNSENLYNRSKVALGLEYMPNPYGRKFSDRIRYRAGFNMSDSYFKVGGEKPANNFGITFGIGLPLQNSNTVINASFEYGKIGSTSLIREDYFKFTFNAVFNENWFFKRKL